MDNDLASSLLAYAFLLSCFPPDLFPYFPNDLLPYFHIFIPLPPFLLSFYFYPPSLPPSSLSLSLSLYKPVSRSLLTTRLSVMVKIIPSWNLIEGERRKEMMVVVVVCEETRRQMK